jgi:murein tripeptide amidase MpaA
MPYLNVDEVESALSVATSAPYNGFTQLITLPNLTWEGRQCHAIKIAKGSNPGRPGVYFLGGVHSREWGSSDILINFIEQLEKAYVGNTGLAFGPTAFSAADIQTLVNTLDIIVFPQANPDGRNYSMNTEALWRKNRRTAAPNSAACPGVDVNRNYDFLWNFPAYFSPAAGIVDSTDPCDGGDPDNGTYNGAAAFSEPESANAKWIFDSFSNVGYFIDLHSYGQDILYSWGDDEDQSTDPTMNFQNPAYNGMRGVAGDAYKEYIPAGDQTQSLALAGTFHDAVKSVRGTDYTVKSAFNLYPTAGTSSDYSYSRHFVKPALSNIISYTVEWGTEFQPPYTEMQNIIQEITCGLLAFCMGILNTLKACTIVLDRDHFGQDEIDALRTQPGGAVVKGAFFVIVDGFTPSQLNITNSSSLGAAPVVGLTPSTGLTTPPVCSSLVSDDPSFGPGIQRFRFGYDINFGNDDSAFTSFSADTEPVILNTTFQGLSASAQIFLIKQPDPFILQGPQTWWLSNDIRLIQVAEGASAFGVTMGSDPFAFLAAVTSALESGQGNAGGQSFDTNTQEDAEVITVAPLNTAFKKVYNFAIARVHYRGLASTAKSVRVFFRMFAANSTDTAFQPDTTFRRYAAYSPTYPVPAADDFQNVLPEMGLQSGEYVTMPFFAEPRIDPTQNGAANTLPSLQTPDSANVKNLMPTGGPLHDTFFGCWLDINQTPFTSPGTTSLVPAMPPAGNTDGPWPGITLEPVQQAFLTNEHNCIVAEIAFDPVAINTGTEPFNSDKMAQRNISWSYVANPGEEASRRVLEPFEVRPTPTNLPSGARPDELMIDWNNVPIGQKAEIYLPAVDAQAVVDKATQLYGAKRLTRLDAHTIGCSTGGVTYIPLPQGLGSANFVGLISVNLPYGIRKGQLFSLLVRQLTNASGRITPPPPPPPPPPQIAARRAASEVNVPKLVQWRKVLGTFQVNVPVGTKELLLPREQQRLSIFRWIGEAMPHQRRWYPVFQRYLKQIGEKVGALGGDPGEILPSPTGESAPTHHHNHHPEHEPCLTFTGKISQLIFDRFGDFEAFLLDTEQGEHEFYSRERDMADLAERAWRARFRITVRAQQRSPHRPLSISFHQPPALPFRSPHDE